MTTTLTQQPLTPSQRQAFALGLTVALKQPVVLTATDGPCSYHCETCGGDSHNLSDAELRELEQAGMCDECDALCKTCGGDREVVMGEDVYACSDCSGRRANQ